MKIALCVCVLLAGLSARQLPYFRNNLALWSHAVTVTPELARPAINLAVAYRQRGEFEIAAQWLVMAGELTSDDQRGAEYRRVIARELNYLEIIGYRVCDQPTAQPYC